jgi:hypothetical protein
MERCSTTEGKIFFMKMQGDYYRYCAECEMGDLDRSELEKNNLKLSEEALKASKDSNECYQQAYELAVAELPPAHPILLGLILNYSVYFFEIVGNVSKACELAQEGLNNALNTLNSGDEYKDSSVILQLIRENLAFWEGSERKTDEENEGDTAGKKDDENAVECRKEEEADV